MQILLAQILESDSQAWFWYKNERIIKAFLNKGHSKILLCMIRKTFYKWGFWQNFIYVSILFDMKGTQKFSFSYCIHKHTGPLSIRKGGGGRGGGTFTLMVGTFVQLYIVPKRVHFLPKWGPQSPSPSTSFPAHMPMITSVSHRNIKTSAANTFSFSKYYIFIWIHITV